MDRLNNGSFYMSITRTISISDEKINNQQLGVQQLYPLEVMYNN